MKIIAIGDTHGKDTWKRIVEKEKDADKIIFIGDYFDSWDIPFEKQMDNFNKILKFQKESSKEVRLLLGNHDYQYITDTERYSGCQDEHIEEIRKVIQGAIDNDLISIGCWEDNFLFTHAGITQTWATENGVEIYNKPTREMWAMLKKVPERFKFTPSTPLDNVGDSITQSPIWVRPRALESNPFDGLEYKPIIQVVGHTRFKNIVIKDKFIYIDVLDSEEEYLIIKDKVPSVGKLSTP